MTNRERGQRVFLGMTRIKRSLATAAVIAAGLAVAAPAHAQSPQGFIIDGPYTVQPTQEGIIAILIGLHHEPSFTPPIGTDKGSFTAPLGSNKGS